MEGFERICRSGRNFRNRSAGSWCGTSNRLMCQSQRRDLPRRSPEEKNSSSQTWPHRSKSSPDVRPLPQGRSARLSRRWLDTPRRLLDAYQTSVFPCHCLPRCFSISCLLQRIDGLIRENGVLRFGGARHACVGAAELRQIALVFDARNIGVMPWTVLALVAHIIRPGGGIHHELCRGVAAPALQLRIDLLI